MAAGCCYQCKGKAKQLFISRYVDDRDGQGKRKCLLGKPTTMGRTLGFKRLRASKTQQKSSFAVVPPWVIVMYNTIFFRNCVSHPNEKKNELDRFCIDCLQSFCSHCLSAHAIHKHVKIRRYIYSDVINRQDLCKLFNCSGIQSYHTNKAKVLFLKQRTHHQQHHQQQQQSNSRDYSCIICDKNLQDNSLYCSIACKVLDIYDQEHREETSNNLHSKLLRCLKDEGEAYVRLPSTKKRRIRQTRKGVPLRAPLF
ncbi:uncharacterized protein LOC110422965 [Herrania umbratica]|uniref:Uncharacterized protein LOC110422965 n=1 Tax=Herrania umbratica TaxID=108875 RepID=A0A6J1B0B4_9ROSI|nr:uncharacterized protein LOC110422965 [Herrania umbratica]